MENHQQFSLKWNNYLQHISGAFDSLRTSEDFVDVTLSCEGKKIKAHKMLLSACSNYFREIFKDNQCTHPVIVFHNIKYEDLSGLVTFMYQGQVNVEQECLQSFLNTAELLEVQGLTSPSSKTVKTEDEDESISDVSSGGGGGSKANFSQSKRKRVKPVEEHVESPVEAAEELPQNDDIPQEEEGEDSLPQTPQFLLHQENSLTQDNSDQYPDSHFYQPVKEEPPDINTAIDQSGPSNDYQDSLQDQSGPSNDFQDSLQVFTHGLWRRLDPSLKRFNCDECGKIFKHPRSLDHHKKMHEGRTTCPVCRRVFGRMYALRLHISASHPQVDLRRLN